MEIQDFLKAYYPIFGFPRFELLIIKQWIVNLQLIYRYLELVYSFIRTIVSLIPQNAD